MGDATCLAQPALGREEHEHRRTQHGRHARHRGYRAASASSASMASRRRVRAPLRGQARRRSRAPSRRWLEPRSAKGRARIGSRSAQAQTNTARSLCATRRALRSEQELRQHGELAASEIAAARTSAAALPSAEVTLARDAVSGEQSAGWFEESTSTDARWHGRNQRRRVHRAASANSAGMASQRRARAPPRGRTRRRSRAPRRRWLEPRSAASNARVGSRRARAPTKAARTPWAMPRALRSEHELPPAWRDGGERERRRADERGDAAER